MSSGTLRVPEESGVLPATQCHRERCAFLRRLMFSQPTKDLGRSVQILHFVQDDINRIYVILRSPMFFRATKDLDSSVEILATQKLHTSHRTLRSATVFSCR
jgi:hypothetical protein